MRTDCPVYFVDEARATRSANIAGDTIALVVRNPVSQACHISHGAEEALAFPLEGKEWKAFGACGCSAFIQANAAAIVIVNLR